MNTAQPRETPADVLFECSQSLQAVARELESVALKMRTVSAGVGFQEERPAVSAADPAERLTVNQVAELLKLHRSTVYRAVESGGLPARRYGRAVRISRADATEWHAKPATIVHQPVTKWGRLVEMEERPTAIRRNEGTRRGRIPAGSEGDGSR